MCSLSPAGRDATADGLRMELSEPQNICTAVAGAPPPASALIIFIQSLITKTLPFNSHPHCWTPTAVDWPPRLWSLLGDHGHVQGVILLYGKSDLSI